MQKILLIDDDQMMLAALSMTLQRHYTVVTAVSGEEGLKLWEAEKPDLIITDLTMPSMDGLEIISHIRRIDKAIPIIATSGMLAGTGVLQAAKHMGANETLNKPFSVTEVLIVVESILKPPTA